MRWALVGALVVLAGGCASGHAHRSRPSTHGASAATTRRPAPAPVRPAPKPLKLRLSEAQVGVIGASLSGPPAARVSVVELRGATRIPIATVRLSSRGRASLPRAGVWECQRRHRRLRAIVLSPRDGTTATALISTPSCAHRLAIRISGDAVSGGNLNVELRDRWDLGALRATICLTPPGGLTTCRAAGLGHGIPSRQIAIALPRPGEWVLSVRSRHAPEDTRTVWAAQPGGLTLLAAGDSEMQILDSFIAQDLAPYGVHVSSDARQSTGLVNVRFFDWQREATLDASQIHPSVTVIFIGANDGFTLNTTSGPVPCCGPAWSQLYAEPVAQLTQTLLRGDLGRVYWILLPAAGPATFQRTFTGVNLAITEVAAQFPGRVGVIDANSVLTPGNVYRNTVTVGGQTITIHEPDGVHLSVAADQIVAQMVAARLRADRIIR